MNDDGRFAGEGFSGRQLLDSDDRSVRHSVRFQFEDRLRPQIELGSANANSVDDEFVAESALRHGDQVEVCHRSLLPFVLDFLHILGVPDNRSGQSSRHRAENSTVSGISRLMTDDASRECSQSRANHGIVLGVISRMAADRANQDRRNQTE